MRRPLQNFPVMEEAAIKPTDEVSTVPKLSVCPVPNPLTADSDTDEDLPANLEALDRIEDAETSTTPAHVFAEADDINSSSWKVTNLFNPPGPGEFDDQLCGVQNPPESPSEVNCFKMFLTEDVITDTMPLKYKKKR
ncbi:hypothetical protein QQF64_027332 [Cirrhinus molitorella]|uniref:Uncharacterized protein n=1 Tax=Cirrhinus molitorella TaxID=172907 RepID=A0ABR3NC28_9TELE